MGTYCAIRGDGGRTRKKIRNPLKERMNDFELINAHHLNDH